MLLFLINPRVRKIRNEASNCLGIFSRTLRFGRAASGGALAPEPPRATGGSQKKIINEKKRSPISKKSQNWTFAMAAHA